MKNKNNNVEILLKSALRSVETPAPELVQKVKYKLIKGEKDLKKTKIKPRKHSFRVAVVTVMMLVFISTTAFAAWYFQSPSEVADKLEFPVLAEAFRSDDALLINQTKSQNGYEVSLLGIVSGKGLIELDKTVDTTKTYAVIAIQKQEDSMSDISKDSFDNSPFFVSPLINGQKPWLYNISSMNGGYRTCIVDGIMYRLIECDNLEMFADRGLELIVSSTIFYDVNAYNYDETTGLVTPNPDYDGINLLFDFPLDSAKADHAKAQQYLDTLWDKKETEENSDTSDEEIGNTRSVDTYTDEGGAYTNKVMTYEDFKAWMEKKLAETQEMVDKGEYSKASMELDRCDYEKNLEQIKNGATLTLHEYEDGSYRCMITFPESGISATLNEDGTAIILNK